MLAYNIGAYMEEAIRGVIRQQTSYPVQLVIAEDCSTDHTLEICLRYQNQYPDIITLVRHEKNAGLQRNFIDAHRHCVGEYIAICDGDDYWTDKHKLQKMTDFMDSHPDYSTCFHRVVNYYEEDGSKSLSNGKQQTVSTVIDLARNNFITNSSSLFRRKYYPEVPAWFAQITSCDYAMHLLNAQHGPIYYFRKPMAVYRKHGKGIWSEAASDKRLNASLIRARVPIRLFQGTKSSLRYIKKQLPGNSVEPHQVLSLHRQRSNAGRHPEAHSPILSGVDSRHNQGNGERNCPQLSREAAAHHFTNVEEYERFCIPLPSIAPGLRKTITIMLLPSFRSATGWFLQTRGKPLRHL